MKKLLLASCLFLGFAVMASAQQKKTKSGIPLAAAKKKTATPAAETTTATMTPEEKKAKKLEMQKARKAKATKKSALAKDSQPQANQ